MFFRDKKTNTIYEGEPFQMFGCLLDGGEPELCSENSGSPSPEWWGSKEQFEANGIKYDQVSSVVFSFVLGNASIV